MTNRNSGFEIFYDSYYNQEPSRVSMLDSGTPESARECPCDECPNYAQCESDGRECVAFRNWALKGDYADNDISRLLRVSKNM